MCRKFGLYIYIVLFLSYDTKISRLLKVSCICPEIYSVCLEIFNCKKILYLFSIIWHNKLPDCLKFLACVWQFQSCARKYLGFLKFSTILGKFSECVWFFFINEDEYFYLSYATKNHKFLKISGVCLEICHCTQI